MTTPYITLELLQARMTEQKMLDLCGENNPAQAEALLSQVIARAQSLVDSYLMLRCKLPLKQVSALIREWTLCIAEYELYKRGPGPAVPEKIRRSYEDTLDRLRELAKGELSLPGEEEVSRELNSSVTVGENTADPNGIKEF